MNEIRGRKITKKERKLRRTEREIAGGIRPSERGLSKGNAECVHLEMYRIQPPRVVVRLCYVHSATMTAAGGTVTSKTWRCNGMYDVDPALGSLVIPGFTEWGALYGINRVIATRARFSVVNYETFPVEVSSGYFPYVIAAGAYLDTNYGNRYCKSFMLGNSSGLNEKTWTHNMNMLELFGNPSAIGDLQQFYGTTSANPSTLMSLCLGMSSPSGTVFTSNGVVWRLSLEFIAEFSGASTLTQLMPAKSLDNSSERPKIKTEIPEDSGEGTSEEIRKRKLERLLIDSKDLSSFKFYVGK